MCNAAQKLSDLALKWDKLDSIHSIPVMSLANSSIVTVPAVVVILGFIRKLGENLLNASSKLKEGVDSLASDLSMDGAWLSSYMDTYDSFVQMEIVAVSLPTHLTLIYISALFIALSNIIVSIAIPNIVSEFKTDIEYVESHSSALSAAINIGNHTSANTQKNDNILKSLVKQYSNKNIKSYAASILEWKNENNSIWFVRALCSILYILGGLGVFIYLFVLLPARVMNFI